jgi:hypothetical protein
LAATPLLLKKIFAQFGQDAVIGSAKFVAICSEYASAGLRRALYDK